MRSNWLPIESFQVIRGYFGDKSSKQIYDSPNPFDVLGTGYQRPFELATLRLFNMIGILPKCECKEDDLILCELFLRLSIIVWEWSFGHCLILSANSCMYVMQGKFSVLQIPVGLGIGILFLSKKSLTDQAHSKIYRSNYRFACLTDRWVCDCSGLLVQQGGTICFNGTETIFRHDDSGILKYTVS